MRTKPGIFAVGLAALVALWGGAQRVSAQPAAIPLQVAFPSNSVIQADIPAGGVRWYQFDLPRAATNDTYLDLFTRISPTAPAPFEDTSLGLYDSVGQLIAFDEEDGPGLAAALSFGAHDPARDLDPDALLFDGRDGDLIVQHYYLAVTGPGAIFGTVNWGVVSGGTAGGTVEMIINHGQASTAPSGIGGPLASNNCVGSSTCLTVAVTPGTAPGSFGLGVTINLSPLGLSPSATMVDDGTQCDLAAGDNTFSFPLVIPPSTPAGSYNLQFTVTDAQGRSSVGIFTLNVVACPSGSGPGGLNPNPRLCTDFEQGTGGWNGFGVGGFSTQTAGGISGRYLRYQDASGGSLVWTNTQLTGNWSSFVCGCTSGSATLDYDVRLFAGSGPVQPYITISNGNASPLGIGAIKATFYPTALVSVSNGWVHISAPIPCTATASSLTTPAGTWVVTGSWSTLLSNVSRIDLRVEIDSNVDEDWGWDNMCLTRCACTSGPTAVYAPSDSARGPADNNGSQGRYGARASSISVTAASDSSFTTRYAATVAAKCNATGNSTDAIEAADSTYSVSFTVFAAPGEPWDVRVDQRRVGDFSSYNDTNGQSKMCITALNCPDPGGGVTRTGTLTMPGYYDCNAGQTFNTNSTGRNGFSQSAAAVLSGVGPQTITLNFHWYATARSYRPNGFSGGDSTGVRLGENAYRSPINNYVSSYSSDPGTQATHGHFVTVTCVKCVGVQCLDFNTATPLPPPASPSAVGGFTVGGTPNPVLYNPFNGGAPPAGGPGQVSGHLRVVESFSPTTVTELNAPASFRGRWDCLCGFLEYDTRVFDDGLPGSGTVFQPLVQIGRDETGNGVFSPSGNSLVLGTFIGQAITEASGWVHVKVPIGTCTGGSTGTWYYPTNTADRDWMLRNITRVKFILYVSNGRSIVDYDNICITDSNNCVRPPSNLVGWWPFDETTVPLHEVAGNAGTVPGPNSGALGGLPANADAPAPCKGVVKGALSFDGINDEVVVAGGANSPLLQMPYSDFSIDAWVKTGTATGEQPIVDKRDFSGFDPPVGYRLFLRNGKLALGMAERSPSGPGETVFQSTGGSVPVVADGNWHMVAGTVKRFGGGAAVRLYVDGALVGQFSPAGKTGGIYNSAAPLYIGSSHPAGESATWFRGCIDEVEIFSKALSQAEIQSVYDACCAGKCKQFISTQGVCSGHFGMYPGVSVKLCNGTSASVTYTLNFANTTGPGCAPVTLGLPGPVNVTLAPFQCATYSYFITVTPALTATQQACYTVTAVPQQAGQTLFAQGRIGCCFCPVPFPDPSGGNPNTSVLFASPIGGGTLPITGVPGYTASNLSFTVTNNGASTSGVRYRIRVLDENGLPVAAELNGLPPGEPVLGTLSVAPGGSALIPFSILLADPSPLGQSTLVLEVDPQGNGQFQRVSSMGLTGSGQDPPVVYGSDFESSLVGDCNSEYAPLFSDSPCPTTSNEFFSSGGQSIFLTGNDTTHAHGASILIPADANTGHWLLDAMVYVPSGAFRNLYAIALDQWPDPVHFGGWMVLDASANNVRNVINSAQRVALVRDQWVQVRFDIDLDHDTVSGLYNGQAVFANQSYRNVIVFPGSTAHGDGRISGFSLFAGDPGIDGSSGVFVDDVRISYLGGSPPVVCVADIVSIGGSPPPDGLITGDDFNAFIAAFAAGDMLADIVSIGGDPPPDGLITGDDFNAFIAAFAAGCP